MFSNLLKKFVSCEFPLRRKFQNAVSLPECRATSRRVILDVRSEKAARILKRSSAGETYFRRRKRRPHQRRKVRRRVPRRPRLRRCARRRLREIRCKIRQNRLLSKFRFRVFVWLSRNFRRPFEIFINRKSKIRFSKFVSQTFRNMKFVKFQNCTIFGTKPWKRQTANMPRKNAVAISLPQIFDRQFAAERDNVAAHHNNNRRTKPNRQIRACADLENLSKT